MTAVENEPAGRPFANFIAEAATEPMRTAVVHPVDEKSLGAARAAHEAGLIEPILIGPKLKIETAADKYEIDLTGIELVEEAVVNARANAVKNGLENVTFFAGDVGEVLEREGLASGEVFDAVVVDPPRAGLMPGAIEQLMRLSIRRLVYVSCNPEALARDIPSLVAAGFSVSRVQTVDMFPQTAHIETIAVLTQGDGDE